MANAFQLTVRAYPGDPVQQPQIRVVTMNWYEEFRDRE